MTYPLTITGAARGSLVTPAASKSGKHHAENSRESESYRARLLAYRFEEVANKSHLRVDVEILRGLSTERGMYSHTVTIRSQKGPYDTEI